MAVAVGGYLSSSCYVVVVAAVAVAGAVATVDAAAVVAAVDAVAAAVAVDAAAAVAAVDAATVAVVVAAITIVAVTKFRQSPLRINKRPSGYSRGSLFMIGCVLEGETFKEGKEGLR